MWYSTLVEHRKPALTLGGGLLGTGGSICAAMVSGDPSRTWGSAVLLAGSVTAMIVGMLLLVAVGIAALFQQRRDTEETTGQLPDPPREPVFRCGTEVLDDGRVEITLRSSHTGSPQDDLALSKQQRRRGFEASCAVDMPEGRGTSLTPLRTGCMVGESVRWVYPDDFDARATPHAPPFPLVTGHYTVKCSWRDPRGSRGKGTPQQEAARCGFAISKTIPATSAEAKRTEVAMKVLGLAIDVLTWFLDFPAAMREADGDSPGERRLRAERDQRVRTELPILIERLRELWPQVEELGIVAPDTYWEPTTLQQAEAWERSLRGLVSALVRS